MWLRFAKGKKLARHGCESVISNEKNMKQRWKYKSTLVHKNS